MLRCGIDLGGTKIAAICLDQNHNTVFEARLPTPQGDYRETLASIKMLVEQAEVATGKSLPVGIGTPGAISTKTGKMKNSNSTCLNGQPLKEDLEKLLNKPVRIANDANCFALSEAIDGAAQGANNVFGVIVGTGTGAGIVIGQQIVDGPNRIAGEWGHNPLPWNENSHSAARLCYCGKYNCIETFLSGPGFEKSYALASQQTLTSPNIVALAEAGDATAELVLTQYERQMAQALSHVINILDPEVIVLGG
ncbi:MAG: ROK family protein, partial [Gammaproteobacteria bacterium]|nr:ROK family protein [Gammaproteobacteria bacterium]